MLRNKTGNLFLNWVQARTNRIDQKVVRIDKSKPHGPTNSKLVNRPKKDEIFIKESSVF